MRDDAVAITFKRIGRFFNNVRSENINFFDWPDSKFPLGHGGERPLDSGKIRDLRIKIDEARFFFGASLRAFLNDMDREAESLLENLGRRYSWEAESDENL